MHENPVHENPERENLEHENLACEPAGEQVAAATITAANHTPAGESKSLKGPIEEYFKQNKALPSTSNFKPLPPSVDSESTPLAATRQQLDSLSAAVITLPNLTRSQRLFSAGTDIRADTLKITTTDEFMLFMRLRKEWGWVSYNMSAKKWAEATALYNNELTCCLLEKRMKAIAKHPRALIDKLGKIETIVLEKIATGNYKCECFVFCLYRTDVGSLYYCFLHTAKSGKEEFWRTHCGSPMLIKLEEAGLGKKPVSISSPVVLVQFLSGIPFTAKAANVLALPHR